MISGAFCRAGSVDLKGMLPVALGLLAACQVTTNPPPLGDTTSTPPPNDAGSPGNFVPPAPPTAPPSDASAPAPPVSLTPQAASVLQFHKNPSHDGVFIAPKLTRAAAKSVSFATSIALPGPTAAQPLYLAELPDGGGEAFITATENNHVFVVDPGGATIWDQTYGDAALGTDLPECFGSTPGAQVAGITGTPIVDWASGTLFFDAMTRTANGPRHLIHAVSLADGGSAT
jgi:hypothetical protein